MTVATIPAYDESRIGAVGDHAVVVGGSMAGMLAASVLSDAFERVTVIERDSLPSDPDTRRGVPQGRHVHALLEAGRDTLEDLFPGYGDDLVTAGAETIDLSSDFNFYDEGDFVADGDHHLPMYCASRPLFEHVTRTSLSGLDAVRLRDGCHRTAYLTDDGASAVEGVRIRNEEGDTEELSADLVVDCTGRTSSTPAWLEANGYRRPPKDEVPIDLLYSTVTVDRPAEDRRAFHVMPCPPRTRNAVVLPIEGDQWIVTLSGLHGDHPPDTVAGLVDFAASLPVDEIARLLADRAITSDGVEQHPFAANVRRRYWDLDRFPDGLLVLGDAMASFNPIYGQGMSVSALEALSLHHALAAGGLDDLALRFFDRAEGVVDDAWNVSVGTDFRFPETTGPKPPGTDILNRYLSRLTRKAHDDETLADAYARVVTMEQPPTSLLRPGVAWRVLKPEVSI
jgi:2-polyprenyl-6-methoxyphenol hydroxylase-like FAD-dependent oxidoreductase